MTIEEIKNRKKQLGWTNAGLASRAGIPVSTVAKILGGTTKNPRQDSVLAMERAVMESRASAPCQGLSREAREPQSQDNELSYVKIVSEMNTGRPGNGQGSMVSDAHYQYGTSAEKEDTGSEAVADADSPHTSGSYTIDDYLALPEERRVELIDGCFYDMAAPTGMHQLILFHIWKTIDACIEEHGLSCIAQGAPFDVQLFGDPYTVVQPDVTVFCTKPEEAIARRARSAPDFVAEVLSPTTAFRDRTQKLCRYRDAGVKEVWIVSPTEQKIWTYLFCKGREEPDEYTFHDSVPVGISEQRCTVDFSKLLKYYDMCSAHGGNS